MAGIIEPCAGAQLQGRFDLALISRRNVRLPSILPDSAARHAKQHLSGMLRMPLPSAFHTGNLFILQICLVRSDREGYEPHQGPTQGRAAVRRGGP
ncbi:hypothetical protein SFOMI_4570 [Sphingobium fuliginis]|uniref:Uncharacterized protein n=1 Tax=Sphingobium fuliginis (strain ATCC 27551) TaxID=336203 RepID=A0A292ZGZ4_SPHSA|nr:hypothetical protein SFOMI_4570 [Sphingobium fuliginis]